MLALVTVPRPAARAEAEYYRQLSESQRTLVESANTPKSMRAYYAGNVKKFAYAAELASRDAVWLPRQVEAARNGRLLVGVLAGNTRSPGVEGVLRLLDAERGTLIFEERVAARDFVKPLQLIDFLAMSLDGSRGLFRRNTHDPGDRRPRLYERALEPGLPEIGELPALPITPASCLQARTGVWVMAVGEYQKKPVLHLIEQGSGKRLAAWPLPAAPCTLAVAQERPLVAVGCPGGLVAVIDLESGQTRRFHPHRGVRRDDWVKVALADSGDWLASAVGDRLVLTRLADGRALPLVALETRDFPGPNFAGVDTRTYLPPAFAFLGEALAVVEGGEVRPLPLPEFVREPRVFVAEAGREGARVPIRFSKKLALVDHLQRARLGRVAGRLIEYHSPALQMQSRALGQRGWAAPATAKAPPPGQSRFGGWPDLPAGTAWPQWAGRPMAFLAQINLAEAHAVEPRLRLPVTGLLSFFLGCQNLTYDKPDDRRLRYMVDLLLGTEREQRDGWRVIYTPLPDSLVRLIYEGEPLPELYAPCSLKFKATGKNLPDEQSGVYPRLGLTRDEQDDYNELLSLLQPERAGGNTENQLLGYPQLIQFTPPEIACELASRGRDPFCLPDENDPEREAIFAAAADWALLLQLTSDGHADFLWGDGGHFYFYGRREPMEQGDFSQVWVYFEN